jgi:hypothetical protein
MEISIKDGTNKMIAFRHKVTITKTLQFWEVAQGLSAEQRAKGFQDVAIKQRFTIMECQSPDTRDGIPHSLTVKDFVPYHIQLSAPSIETL